LSVILDPPPTSPLHQLSAREIQVLKLVVEGRTSKEIARALGLFPSSIDTYRSRIMAKLGVRDVPALVRLAIRSGLTDL
jgi:DNA-binding CsgD family transcriptional regulator